MDTQKHRNEDKRQLIACKLVIKKTCYQLNFKLKSRFHYIGVDNYHYYYITKNKPNKQKSTFAVAYCCQNGTNLYS